MSKNFDYYLQKVFAIICIVLTISMIISLIQGTQAYELATEERTTESEELYSEVLFMTSPDGYEMKGVYFIAPQYQNYSNHSIPLIITCHGMSSNWMCFGNMYRSFAEAGYAIFTPEFRGHGGNDAPSTLGYLEYDDVINWLDYLEDTQMELDVNQSGIYGHSMGGLYAIGAYIKESLGRGRLKAVASGSGPLNISREIAFLTNNADPVGPMSMIDHLEEKNPVNMVNTSFPNNILLFHGQTDIIVDYQCTIDFYGVIDPNQNRSDVEFYSSEGGHEEAAQEASLTKQWFDWYILGIENSTYTELNLHINKSIGSAAQEHFKDAAYALMILIPLLVLAVRPAVLEIAIKNNKVIQTNMNQESDSEKTGIGSMMKKFVILLSFFVVVGLVFWKIPLYLADKIGGMILAELAFVFWMERKNPKSADNMQKSEFFNTSFNWKATALWTVIVTSIFVIYGTIISQQTFIQMTYTTGFRFSWWLFFFAATITTLLIMTYFTTRFGLSWNHWNKESVPVKYRLSGALWSGLIMGCGFGFFLFPLWHQSHLIIPSWFSFDLGIIVTLAVLFGIIGFLGDILMQFSQRLLKSVFPAAFLLSIFVTLTISGSSLIFFY